MANAKKLNPFTLFFSFSVKAGFVCVLVARLAMAEPVLSVPSASCFDPSSMSPVRVGEPILAMGAGLLPSQCDSKRENANPQSAQGFCGCLADLSKKTSDADFVTLNYTRIKRLEESVIKQAVDEYTEDYFEDSMSFGELYLSAVKSGLFEENEIYAVMTTKDEKAGTAMTRAEFNSDPKKDQLIKEAQSRLSLCAGQEVAQQFKEYEEAGYCAEGMKAFKDSARTAFEAKPELKAFIESSATSSSADNFSDAVRQAEQVQGQGILEVEPLLKSLADLVAAGESSAEYADLLAAAVTQLSSQPTYAKALEAKYDHKEDTRSAIVAFVKDNIEQQRSGKGTGDLGKDITASVNNAQRFYFLEGLTKCVERNRKLKLFCDIMSPEYSGVHIDSLIELSPTRTPEIVEGIAKRENLSSDEQRRLTTDLDMMTCVGMGSRESLCRNQRSTAPRTEIDYTYFFPVEPEAGRRPRYCVTLPGMTHFYPELRAGRPMHVGRSNRHRSNRGLDAEALPQSAIVDQTTDGRSPASLPAGANDFLSEDRGVMALENNPALKQNLDRVFSDIGDTRSRSEARARGGHRGFGVYPSHGVKSSLSPATSVTAEKDVSKTPTVASSISSALDNVRRTQITPSFGDTSGVIPSGDTTVADKNEEKSKLKEINEKKIEELSDSQLSGKEDALVAELKKLKEQLAKFTDESKRDSAQRSEAENKEIAALKEQLQKEINANIKMKEGELARVKQQQASRERQRVAAAATTLIDNSASVRTGVDSKTVHLPAVKQNDFAVSPGGTLKTYSGDGAYAARSIVQGGGSTVLALTSESKPVPTGVDSSQSAFEKLPADISSQISKRLASGEEVVYATFADDKQYAYTIDPETQEIVLIGEVQIERPVTEQMSYAELLKRDEERIYIDRAPASEGSVEAYQGLVESLNETLIKGVGPQQNSR